MRCRAVALLSTVSHKSTCCIWSTFQKGAAKGFSVREGKLRVSVESGKIRRQILLQWCWSRTNGGWFYSKLSSQGWKKLFQGHRYVPSHLEYHKHTVFRGLEVVLQDLHVSFFLFQMPHKQHSTDLLYISFSSLPPGNHQPDLHPVGQNCWVSSVAFSSLSWAHVFLGVKL